MTRLELHLLVCQTLDVISYRIGLQYQGVNKYSESVMTMLDCYNNNHVLSEREVDIVNKWLATYKASK